jgi:hypothetical protein
MTPTWWKRGAKPFVVMAAVGVAALSAVDARAMQVNPGDLVLAMFSNGTEYYQNLGQASSLLSGPAQNINIGASSLNPFTVTAGSNPILWGLISVEGQTQLNTFMNGASTKTAQEIVDSQTVNSVNAVKASMDGWRNLLLLNTPAGNEATLPASDPASWNTNWGLNGSLGGNMGAASFQGNLDSILTVVKGQSRVGAQLNVFSDVGRAVLASNGLFSICGGAGCELQPVPIPAAAVLFGSGLIGLIGIARRKIAPAA